MIRLSVSQWMNEWVFAFIYSEEITFLYENVLIKKCYTISFSITWIPFTRNFIISKLPGRSIFIYSLRSFPINIYWRSWRAVVVDYSRRLPNRKVLTDIHNSLWETSPFLIIKSGTVIQQGRRGAIERNCSEQVPDTL